MYTWGVAYPTTSSNKQTGSSVQIPAKTLGGGQFIGPSSEIARATPLENVLAFYGAARELGRYPIEC
jgi:hypothetical protein